MVSVPGETGVSLWKVNPLWLQLFPADDPIPIAITHFIWDSKGTATMGMVWNALKTHLRGLLIRQIPHIKTATNEWETFVLSEVRRAEESYIVDTPSSEQNWIAVLFCR